MEEKEFYKFKFKMEDPNGNVFETKSKVQNYEDGDELYFIVEQFKDFLRYCGYSEISISTIQVLEDEEWKYVLTQYGEWNSELEKVYQARMKRFIDKNKEE